MRGIGSMAWLAFAAASRRMKADPRLSLAAGLGVLLAVALVAAGFLYSSALREAALQQALGAVPREETNLSLRVTEGLRPERLVAMDSFVRSKAVDPLRSYLRDDALFVQTAVFFFSGRPEWDASDDTRPRGPVQFMTGMEGRTRLVEGRLPQFVAGGMEVLIDRTASAALGLKPGDTFQAFPATYKDGRERPTKVTVVGVMEPVDPSDEFWFGGSGKFTQVRAQWTSAPLYVASEALLNSIGRAYPGLFTEYTWYLYLDRKGLRAASLDSLEAAWRQATSDVRDVLGSIGGSGGLFRVAAAYRGQLLVARIPLFLLVTLVVGILLYYLGLVALLMARVRSPETALLKSRGASDGQVALLGLAEGALLAAPSVLVGPLLAQGAVFVAGQFTRVGQARGLPVTLGPGTFAAGALAGLLAVGVITAATLLAARRTAAESRQAQARPATPPFFQRYYLDLLLLALSGLAWWQVHQRGSFLFRPLGEEQLRLDFSLLVGPAVATLAAALLLMRLLPLALALLSRVAATAGPVWLVQGLRRAARDPYSLSALVVLLVLATSLGVLGAAVGATLERSGRERALYQAGADLRLQLYAAAPTGAGAAEALAAVPGVAAAAEAVRDSGTLAIKGFGQGFALLAVDSKDFARVAWTRPDFTRQPLPELMDSLQAPVPDRGIPVPKGATSLGVWAAPSYPMADARVNARLRDAAGRYFDVALGRLDGQGWRWLEGPITPVLPTGRAFAGLPAPVAPYLLVGLIVTRATGSAQAGALFLDGLAARVGGETVVLSRPESGLQDASGWRPLVDPLSPDRLVLEASEAVVRASTEGRSLALTWSGEGAGPIGILQGPAEPPLPALVSRTMLTSAGLSVGDTAVASILSTSVPIRVVGVLDYFPTLSPSQGTFMVLDKGRLLDYVALHSPRPLLVSPEVWVSALGGGPDMDGVRHALEAAGYSVSATYDARELVKQQSASPLVTAGWSGLVLLAFAVVVVASAAGITLFLYLDARERLPEFALLGSLGVTRRQLSAIVWFNLALLAAAGVGLGTWAGGRLATALLPLLAVAEGGRQVTPPLVLQTGWAHLAIVYLVVALAAGVAALFLGRMAARLEVAAVLRAGER
ncbi:MAG: hypothetical protein HY683_09375 [Chloroflexi bacterium]|nr:hypothetical protein [Chloroflexota bacterium]